MMYPISKERLYSIWRSMHDRCENKKNVRYQDYGGRGITICEDWSYYSRFCAWAYSSGYTDLYTIERIDVNGNYEPSNCKWITLEEQAKNKQNTIRPICNGIELEIEGWDNLSYNQKRYAIDKLENGLPIKRAYKIVGNDKPSSISVKQRKDKWEYRFSAPKTLDGKRSYIIKGGFTTKQEAFAAARQRISELYGGVQNAHTL